MLGHEYKRQTNLPFRALRSNELSRVYELDCSGGRLALRRQNDRLRSAIVVAPPGCPLPSWIPLTKHTCSQMLSGLTWPGGKD